MKQRKMIADLVLLICLLAVLAAIIALRSTVYNVEQYTFKQVAGKLENPTGDALSARIAAEPEVRWQVNTTGTQQAHTSRYSDIQMSAEERDELAAVVYLEARGESAEGQQAIVEVVLNRVLNDGFPDTVHEVLHEGEGNSCPQFSTVYQINEATPTQTQYDAIDSALNGDSLLDADVVFFSCGGENDRVWGQIGKHIFCREYIWG